MKVVLYNVGRNLNRAYRTCFSFGVDAMILVGASNDQSIKWELKGNLYRAKSKVKIIQTNILPNLNNALILENYYNQSLYNITNWQDYDMIVIGGETSGVPKSIKGKTGCRIPTINNFCLTVEASLAIALSEWYKYQLEIGEE